MDLSPIFVGLTDRERIYVESRLKGLGPTASNAAAGIKGPPSDSGQSELVQKALVAGRAASIEATGMTRERISEMFLDAFRCAESATEMVAAARELGKLHGVYAAAKVSVNHQVTDVRRVSDLRNMTIEQLEQLAKKGGVIDAEFTELPVKERLLIEHGSPSEGTEGTGV